MISPSCKCCNPVVHVTHHLPLPVRLIMPSSPSCHIIIVHPLPPKAKGPCVQNPSRKMRGMTKMRYQRMRRSICTNHARTSCDFVLGLPVPMPLLDGIRQRLGRAPWVRGGRGHGLVVVGAHGVDEEDEDFTDYVAEFCVTNAMTGLVTQKSFAKADQARAKRVSELGGVGNRGKAKTNIHRDLMRKLMKGCTFFESYCRVPCSQQRGRRRGIT